MVDKTNKVLVAALLKIQSICSQEHVAFGPGTVTSITTSALATFFNQPNLDKEHEDVRAFHEKFNLLSYQTPGHLTRRKLKERVECMQEELAEFIEGCSFEEDDDAHQDLAKQADALVDLVYFAKGTSVMLGLPWADLWDDVQRANMTKVRGIGPRSHAVDCVKPAGWVGPKTHEILLAHGYSPRQGWDKVQRDDAVHTEAVSEDDKPTNE